MWIIPLISALVYCIGENYNKNLKYAMGFPIGILGSILLKSYFPLLSIITYFLATWGIGYGDNNWLTKLIGKGWAIVITGFCLGLASMPILGFFALLQALIGAGAYLTLHILDDMDKIKEPFIGLLRGFLGTIVIAFK